jgi:hypothetical protein
MTSPRFQFSLLALFGLILAICVFLGAWLAGGFLAAFAWLPVEMLLAMFAVELAASALPFLIDKLAAGWCRIRR